MEINLELLGNTVIPKACSRSFFTNGIKVEVFSLATVWSFCSSLMSFDVCLLL